MKTYTVYIYTLNVHERFKLMIEVWCNLVLKLHLLHQKFYRLQIDFI